jgi:hypothetical protein
MAEFPASLRAAVQKSYDDGVAWTSRLQNTNKENPSAIRDKVQARLYKLNFQIAASGFPERAEFSQEEQNSIASHAEEINRTIDGIKDSNAIVLMELGTDLAELVVMLGHRGYMALLNWHWITARKRKRLPAFPPEEVQDEFNVHLFNLVQGKLNATAVRCKPIAAIGCLTPDDYDSELFRRLTALDGLTAADMTEDTFLDMQQLKAEEAAAREGASVGILEEIWDIVGWDDPLDFLVDVGLTVATGGASKIMRWTDDLIKTTKRLRHSVNTAERALRLNQRAQRVQVRISEIKRAAEALKRTRQIAEIPKKLLAALRTIEKAENNLKILSDLKKKVQPEYIRSVASTISARTIGHREANLGDAATYELARQSFIAAFPQIQSMIDYLRSEHNITDLLTSAGRRNYGREVLALFTLLFIRELGIRLIIQIARKATSSVIRSQVNQSFTMGFELFFVQFEGAFLSACESMLIDIPGLSKVKANELARTFVSTIRKTVTGMAQEAFRDWYNEK